MNITETVKDFEVTFPYDYVKLQAVKNIPGSWYQGAKKVWHVPKHLTHEINRLRQKFSVTEMLQAPTERIVHEAIPELPELAVDIPTLKRTLFPFQGPGAQYCINNKRVIVGDQPGLGKTTTVIAAIEAVQSFPALIICPATLKLNWREEWMAVSGRRSMILTDRVKNTWQQYYNVGMVDVFIVNYESLKKFFVKSGWNKPTEGQFKMNMIPFRENINIFKTVVVDESHKCKDGSTQQAKFVMGIAKNKEYVYELTGTPVVNKPKDLITQLHIVDRLRDVVDHIPRTLDAHGKLKDYSGYNRFIHRYCGGGHGATNLEELNYRLNKFCFFRREKSEVLKDLPAKIRQIVLCDIISNRSEYDKAENEFVAYLKEVRGCTDAEVRKKLRGEVMVKMGILKQISARGKMDAVRDHIDEIVDSDEKVVVFCSLREIGDSLKHFYPDAVMIRGGMSDEEKNLSVQRFQKNKNTKVIICSIKAAGVGLTLTASSRVVFVEFPWTDADCEQCEDRTHRIGQQDSVTAAYFLGEQTIDRYCYDLILKKRKISQTITGAEDNVAEEIIDELLNLFNQR